VTVTGGYLAEIPLSVFRRLLPRLGYKFAIWAIAHRLCRVVWKILHEGFDSSNKVWNAIPNWGSTAPRVWQEPFASLATTSKSLQ
jgi:hypothetical protein